MRSSDKPLTPADLEEVLKQMPPPPEHWFDRIYLWSIVGPKVAWLLTKKGWLILHPSALPELEPFVKGPLAELHLGGIHVLDADHNLEIRKELSLAFLDAFQEANVEAYPHVRGPDFSFFAPNRGLAGDK